MGFELDISVEGSSRSTQFFRFYQKVSDLLGRAAAVVVVVCGLINDHQFLYEKGLINEPHFMS